MSFKVGDRVVHPRYGLGKVTQLAIKQFVEGEKRLFYEIAFPDSILWVPFNLSTSGIRKVTGKGEIMKCRKLLETPAAPLNGDLRLRQKDLSNHLKTGTFTAQCEVVRDLTEQNRRKPLSSALTVFFSRHPGCVVPGVGRCRGGYY